MIAMVLALALASQAADAPAATGGPKAAPGCTRSAPGCGGGGGGGGGNPPATYDAASLQQPVGCFWQGPGVSGTCVAPPPGVYKVGTDYPGYGVLQSITTVPDLGLTCQAVFAAPQRNAVTTYQTCSAAAP